MNKTHNLKLKTHNYNMTDQNKPNISSQKSSEEDEIDLIQLAKTLWEGRKTVIKITLIFMGIGLFVAIFSKKEYTASTTFMPQTTDSKIGGSLGGLAAMAGINLGGMSSNSGIAPSLYPQVLNSIPFQKELLQTPLTIEGEKDKVTFTNYYTEIHSPGFLGYLKKYTIGLPGVIILAIKGKPTMVTLNGEGGSDLLSISEEEFKLIKILNNQISLEVNDDDGYVTIASSMPEALASAEMALRVQQLLQQYVIDFKIQKSKEQLEFIKSRYSEVEEKFKIVQQKLANNRDRNQNLSTAIAKTSTEMLQDEYNLIYNVYSELAKQLEAQYIQVTEDTPVFTVLKPVTVPIEKSKPKRFSILFMWIIAGVFIGTLVVFGKEYLSTLKNQWGNIK
jgi:capsular polysaccharide biosynthesis protein